MLTFCIRRLFYSALILYGVITVTFLLMFVLPGDPARLMLGQRADVASVAAIRKQLGLDQPMTVQYLHFVEDMLPVDVISKSALAYKTYTYASITTFNNGEKILCVKLPYFGRSFSSNRDVLSTIFDRFPATGLLALSSIIIATVLGIIVGIISAVKPYSIFDGTSMVLALLGISLPVFVFGLLAALLFGVILKWLPISGYINNGWEYLILPAVTLGLRPLSVIARITRSSMLDVLGQDYVRTARAKGLSRGVVIFRHALRNAMNPVITTVSAWLAGLLAGAFFTEYIFNWPGIGELSIDAIQKLDFPMIEGTVLFTAIIFVIVNFLVDILYAVLDPKVKLS
jgi:peptide/nickel transport system permease protein